jgi:hypothetical protein
MRMTRIPGGRLERRRQEKRERWTAPFRVTPLHVYAAAWLFLAGAIAAVVIAQLDASPPGPWLSMGYSAGAVVCTVVAVSLRLRPRGVPEDHLPDQLLE